MMFKKKYNDLNYPFAITIYVYVSTICLLLKKAK